MIAIEEEKGLEAVFGRGLRRLRRQQGMKVEALAEMAGYKNHTNIVKIEGGKTLPSLGKAFMLARILHVPVEAFLVEGYVDEALAHTYREVLLASKESRAAMVRLLRTMADDLERTLGSTHELTTAPECATLMAVFLPQQSLSSVISIT